MKCLPFPLAAILAASPALASAAPEHPAPALTFGCGVHLPGPFSARDADNGMLLLSIPAGDSLDTDCSVSDAPLVFDGESHRAIIRAR